MRALPDLRGLSGLRCSDCNGVIEGRRSFCPHCGQKLGKISSGRVRKSVSDIQERSVLNHRPSGENEFSGRFISKNLRSADAEAARRVFEKLKQSGVSTNIDPRVIKVVITAIAGAFIGSMLPGQWGFAGAMVGLFIGLRGLRKN